MTHDEALDLLGMSLDSDPSEINAAFRRMAMSIHQTYDGDERDKRLRDLISAKGLALDYAETAPCSRCNGLGAVRITRGGYAMDMLCDKCGGSGERK